MLLALTFKVPLLFPPTFTLILLPKENFQNRKGKEMSDEQRRACCLLFQLTFSLKTNPPALPTSHFHKFTSSRVLSHFSPLKPFWVDSAYVIFR